MSSITTRTQLFMSKFIPININVKKSVTTSTNKLLRIKLLVKTGPRKCDSEWALFTCNAKFTHCQKKTRPKFKTASMVTFFDGQNPFWGREVPITVYIAWTLTVNSTNTSTFDVNRLCELLKMACRQPCLPYVLNKPSFEVNCLMKTFILMSAEIFIIIIQKDDYPKYLVWFLAFYFAELLMTLFIIVDDSHKKHNK